jgi:hypothetical protein
MHPADGHGERVAGAVAESDRIAAARFGSLDLARGLLKQYVAAALWPAFQHQMTAELKAQATPEPNPYEFIGRRFAEFLTPERIAAAVSNAPTDFRDRLARLSCAELPEIAFFPFAPSLLLLRHAEALERELSTAERARVVFERPAGSWASAMNG